MNGILAGSESGSHPHRGDPSISFCFQSPVSNSTWAITNRGGNIIWSFCFVGGKVRFENVNKVACRKRADGHCGSSAGRGVRHHGLLLKQANKQREIRFDLKHRRQSEI
jgi:hypothetical protein